MFVSVIKTTEMMKGILLVYLLLIARLATSQTNVIGSVTDKHGEPVIGANVSVKGTYDGASTNIEGKFKFKTFEHGEHIVQVSFIGYKPFHKSVELDGDPLTIEVILEEEINKLNAVVISAGSFSASEEGKREVLKSVDIATTAGATADIAGALNTLPGTQKVGETGRLFVRGGEGYETKTFIDGMQVMNAYSSSAPNTPGRGRFSPFMFKGTSFSTGGYSAEFGQALSSALILDTKDLVATDRVDLGIMSVGADIGVSKAWEQSSLSAKIEYTNIAPYFDLVPQNIDWRDAPQALSGNYAYRIKTSETGMMKFYGNFSHSEFALSQNSLENTIENVDLDNLYNYWNATYKEILSDKMSLRLGISYTTFNENSSYNSNLKKDEEDGIHSKLAVNYDLSDKVALVGGTELYVSEFNENLTDSQGAIMNLGYNELISATFVEAEVYTSANFVTRFGSRIEYSKLTGKIRIDPRASFGYKTGENSQISMAYGRFQQQADNNLLKVANDLETERADHYILNYQLIKDKRTFRVEAYYKLYDNLVKFNDVDIYNPTLYNNNGDGYGRGIDVFWRDNQTFDNTDYWVSYSYLDTERDYRNYTQSAVPSFASSHNFSIVYKRFIQSIKSQIGATYSYTSGRPYHNPNMEGFQNSMTKSYQDFSLNISYLYSPSFIVHASATNIFGRQNVFGYEYRGTPDVNGVYNGRAITQSVPRFLFLGIFITLNKEKNVNQLRNL